MREIIKQYDDTHGKQGAWTDIYSLGASYDILWARAEKNHIVKVGANNTTFGQSDFSFAFDSDGDGSSNIDDAQPTVANKDV